mgnify:CR=1 FL=1
MNLYELVREWIANNKKFKYVSTLVETSYPLLRGCLGRIVVHQYWLGEIFDKHIVYSRILEGIYPPDLWYKVELQASDPELFSKLEAYILRDSQILTNLKDV